LNVPETVVYEPDTLFPETFDDDDTFDDTLADTIPGYYGPTNPLLTHHQESLSSYTIPRVDAAVTPPTNRRLPLTNRNGLVVMSKEFFLKRLHGEWRHLLDPKSMMNLCFYFECPFSFNDYNEANSANSLDKLGAFAHSRWEYMAEIHVLLPGDHGHIYVAERADLPHYQAVFAKFILALESYDGHMPVYLYTNGNDYDNHFLSVRNSGTSVQPFVDSIDWMEVLRIANRPKKTTGKVHKEKARQSNFKDTGFCSGMNQTRGGTADGIAEPRLKTESTQDLEVINGYVVLSRFIATATPKWVQGNRQLFSNPKRQSEFASRIHKENVFESMRLSVTDLASHCACHRDEHNSYDPLFSAVVGVSVVRMYRGRKVRIGLNAQGRKAIDDKISRSDKYRPLLNLVLSEYDRMPTSRRFVTKDLLVAPTVAGVAGLKGFGAVKSPCNMDPMGFYQPFIHYILLLVDHFGLSLPETVGLISAIEVLPNTSYYFSAAAQALLATHPDDLHRCHRGFAFGYLVASLLLRFRQQRTVSCPGVRFCIYWEAELPTGQEWEDRCTLKTLACLRFHAAFDSLVDKKKRATQYKKLRKHFCSTTAQCDLLVTNHVLGICSVLGLLPSWVRNEIEVSATSRYMKWFLTKYEIPTGSETVEQITEALKHLLSLRYQIPFSRRHIENILCKVYRNKTNGASDRRFCDIAFPGQMLFTCEGGGLRIMFPEDSILEDTFVDQYLIAKWPFDNSLLSVEDLIGKLGMSDKGVPTAKEAENWSVPESLMFGRARTKIEFDIGNKVEVECASFFQFHLNQVSKGLRGTR
jgi:hypothetical protein